MPSSPASNGYPVVRRAEMLFAALLAVACGCGGADTRGQESASPDAMAIERSGRAGTAGGDAGDSDRDGGSHPLAMGGDRVSSRRANGARPADGDRDASIVGNAMAEDLEPAGAVSRHDAGMDAGELPIVSSTSEGLPDLDGSDIPDAGPVAGPDAAGSGVVADCAGSRFAVSVRDHHFGPGQNFGQADFPEPVLGPPRGGGCCGGSLDVVSLGNGGYVELAFNGTVIVDGPGPDFLVFENPFFPGGDESSPNAELATVAVSEDGESWREFPCTESAYPYGTCAGWHPVYANVDNNRIDPTDPDVAGGDPFDLAELGIDRARYVRITDRADLDGSLDGVFDLDAVAIVNAECAP